MQDFEQNKRQILDRVDIFALASEHVTLKQSGRRWVGLCPFHSEKTPSFTVSPERGSFKCFGCGQGGDVFSFVQLKENVSFVEAMRILADRAGVELGRPTGERSSGPSRADVAKVNAWARDFFRSNLQDDTIGRSARAYLSQRGVTEKSQEDFAIGLAVGNGQTLTQAAGRAGFDATQLLAADLVRRSDGGRTYDTFRQRLIFPISDATRRVVGFGGRTLVDDRAKYLNTAQNILFDKGTGLYAIELARDAISARGRAVLVEGYTDCLAAHQAGFTETVATLGTALTEVQVDLLRRYTNEIIILFDSDEAGHAAANRGIHLAIPRCISVKLARIPNGKDPAEFLQNQAPQAFSDVLNEAVNALEFMWQGVLSGFGGATDDRLRRDAITEFLGLISTAVVSGAVDVIQRGLLVNQVARLLQISPQEIHGLLGRMAPKRQRQKPQPVDVRLERLSNASSGEQAAWRHMLQALLNEPGAWPTDAPRPDVTRIDDPRVRRVASVVFDLLDELGEFRVTEALARFEDPDDARLVTDLADAGASWSGNYQATVALALERIQSASVTTSSATSSAKGGELLPDGHEHSANDALERVQAGMMDRKHFAPPRNVRHALGVVTGSEVKTQQLTPTEQL